MELTTTGQCHLYQGTCIHKSQFVNLFTFKKKNNFQSKSMRIFNKVLVDKATLVELVGARAPEIITIL